MSSDPLVVVARLADVLDQLGISYLVGDSLASSVYGIPRATNDVDLVAAIQRMHVQPFQEALGGDFYVAEELILEAILNRSSFNVIHLATMFKADIRFQRRQRTPRRDGPRAKGDDSSGCRQP